MIRIIQVIPAATAGSVVVVVPRTTVIIIPIRVITIPPWCVIVNVPVSWIVAVITTQTGISENVAFPDTVLAITDHDGIDLFDHFNRITGRINSYFGSLLWRWF